MDDGAPRTDQRLIGAHDQLIARLGQHLDGDVGRDVLALDELAAEIEIGLRWRRESRSRFPCSPCFTRVWNMRSLRSGPIGSISAWLPSRRSTLHQIGALVMVRPGHCRSGKLNGWNGRYFAVGSTRMADILSNLKFQQQALSEALR